MTKLVFYCCDNDEDPQHLHPHKIEADDPLRAAEDFHEFLDMKYDFSEQREVYVRSEEGREWIIYTIAIMKREYESRLLLPFPDIFTEDEEENNEF